MTNREWLNSIDNKAMAIKIVPPHSECEYCIINAECNHAGACIDKLVEWLGKEHIEPMPSLQVGDIVNVKFSTSLKMRGTIVGKNVVLLHGGYECQSFNGHIKNFCTEIKRYNEYKGEMEVIWRAE